VTWNTLLDYKRTDAGIIWSQAARLPSQIATLEKLRDELGTELDAVALQEVHKTAQQHNGVRMAEVLGYGTGYGFEHNKKPFPGSKTGRPDEYMWLFGARIDHAEPIDLGDNRLAILSHIGKTTLVNIHPRAGIINGDLQLEQVGVALRRVDGCPFAAFVGDFNQRLGRKARRAIEAEEFKSVFTLTDQPHPGIYPTPAYREIMYGSAHRFVPDLIFDDIYVRGLEVFDAGSFIGDSDHAGLWAKIEDPN
jgi:hypothetical protein